MKLIKPVVLFYLVIAVFSCNSKKGNKEGPVNPETKNQTTQKTIVKETGQDAGENLLPIELAVKEMLTTSPRFKQLTKGLQEKLVKNGGLYFGVYLERSPEQSKVKEGNYSKTYDFTIYEIYEERQVNTSRFSFNPDNNQFFEHDISNDSLIPIKFDRALLARYDSLNK